MKKTKFGQWVPIFDPRIRDHKLSFQNPENGSRVNVPVPFGVVLPAENFHLEARTDGNAFEVRAVLGQGEADIILLSPPFRSTGNIGGNRRQKKVALEFWAVDDFSDRLECIELLSALHYLKPPTRGIFLACRFQQAQEHRARGGVLKKTRLGQKRSRWEQPNAIIACAVIDTLYHGKPSGRESIAKELGFRGVPKTWSRAEAIEEMKVAWLSRLAVAPTYQRMGVATLLAIKAKELSRKARLPRADFLEVIRSFPASKSKQRVTGSKDFLTSAGFKVAPKPMISRPCTFLDSGSGIRIPQSAVKSYYYADLRNDD